MDGVGGQTIATCLPFSITLFLMRQDLEWKMSRLGLAIPGPLTAQLFIDIRALCVDLRKSQRMKDTV
jgi:hypothetical protein